MNGSKSKSTFAPGNAVSLRPKHLIGHTMHYDSHFKAFCKCVFYTSKYGGLSTDSRRFFGHVSKANQRTGPHRKHSEIAPFSPVDTDKFATTRKLVICQSYENVQFTRVSISLIY